MGQDLLELSPAGLLTHPLLASGLGCLIAAIGLVLARSGLPGSLQRLLVLPTIACFSVGVTIGLPVLLALPVAVFNTLRRWVADHVR
jgi:hypothetical protein